jgi:hypothetical protein
VKIGDFLVRVNGQSLKGLPLNEIISRLDASNLQMEFLRRKPKLPSELAEGYIEQFSDKHLEDGFTIEELVYLLNDPPSSLAFDDLMSLVHVFQELVSKIRREENEYSLAKTSLLKVLGKTVPGANDWSEAAATVVSRSMRFLEDLEASTVQPVDSGGVFSTVLGTIRL